MIRKLTSDSIQVDLANITRMIESANKYGDFVGAYQFTQRKEDLQSELEKIKAAHVTNAGVALFFSGEPVLGSKGIVTSFAGKALQRFQEIVTKSYATLTLDKLGERGRVPLAKESSLLITGVAHGSFGFVLEEDAGDQPGLIDTSLKEAVEFAVGAIVKSSSEDDDTFVALTETLNSRLLLALNSFFSELDSYNATVRLVDDHRDYAIGSSAIERARARIAGTTIEDEEKEIIVGTLNGFMPHQKRFEMILNGNIILGSATDEATAQVINLTEASSSPIGHECRVQMDVRTIQPFNRDKRKVYRLLNIVEVGEQSGLQP